MIPYAQMKYMDIFGYTQKTEILMLSVSCIIFILVLIWSLRANKIDINPNKDFSLFILIFIICYLSAMVGARIAFYFDPWNGFRSILEFLNPDPQGLVSYGALIGGALGILLCYLLFKKRLFGVKASRVDSYRLFDAFVIPFSIAIAIFRIGCFFDGHIVGKPTDLPWCIEVSGNCTHPVALYYIFLLIIIIIVLLLLFWKPKTEGSFFGRRFDSELSSWFVLAYCSGCIFIELFRLHRSSVPFFVYLVLSLAAVVNLINNYILLHDRKIKSLEGARELFSGETCCSKE